MAERCSRTVYGGGTFRGSPCGNKGKVEVNGKWFCGAHSPEAEERRKAKRKQKYDDFVAASDRRAKREAYRDACVNAFHSPTRTIATENIPEGVVWEMHTALKEIIDHLPRDRDWLDPALEAYARGLIALFRPKVQEPDQ